MDAEWKDPHRRRIAELEAEVAALEGRSAADHMKYQSHLETKVVKLEAEVAGWKAREDMAYRQIHTLEAEVAARDKRLNSWRDEIRMCHGEDCECRICGDEPLAALLEGKQDAL